MGELDAKRPERARTLRDKNEGRKIMRITELFTAQSIALDEALTDQEQIISRLVELQATHGNITDKDAYKKALYAREAEGSTFFSAATMMPSQFAISSLVRMFFAPSEPLVSTLVGRPSLSPALASASAAM